jgi:uncharacterized membrane protein YfcA
MLTSDTSGWTTMGLGLALMVYSAFTLFARQLSVPKRLEGRLSPWIGLSTGLVTGGTGVFVIPAVPYLQALGLDKDDLIQALGLSFTVSTIALAIGLTAGARRDGLGAGHSGAGERRGVPALVPDLPVFARRAAFDPALFVAVSG